MFDNCNYVVGECDAITIRAWGDEWEGRDHNYQRQKQSLYEMHTLPTAEVMGR